MRCRSLSLLREAMRLSRARASAADKSLARLDAALPLGWYTQYWESLEDSSRHVALLYPQMLQSSLLPDLEQHTICFKACLVVSLTAQIELHSMPGFYHPESRQKALSTTIEVIGLTKSWKEDDYIMLEPTLRVSTYRPRCAR